MNRFRLVQWAELPEEFDQLRFRRAMMAMSAGPVDRHRLSEQCGLDPKETLAFLRALFSVGAISVHRGERMSTKAPGVMSRLRHWLNADAPLLRAAGRG